MPGPNPHHPSKTIRQTKHNSQKEDFPMRQWMIVGMILVLVTLVGACVPTPQITPEPAAESPDQVVEGYYRWYFDYARGTGNPLVDRAYRDSDYLTPALVEKVDGIIDSFTGGGYDPFLCAQDIPGQVEADKAVVVGSEATIVVHMIWNPGTEAESVHDLTVVLRQVDGQWRIDNILCGGASAAEPPDQVVEGYYRWYLDYARGTGNPLVDRAYRDSDYLTARLVEKVDGILDALEGGGYDPFLCAQDIPESLTVEPVAGTETEASVLVRTSFEGHTFTVALVLVDGRWLIDDVHCGGQ